MILTNNEPHNAEKRPRGIRQANIKEEQSCEMSISQRVRMCLGLWHQKLFFSTVWNNFNVKWTDKNDPISAKCPPLLHEAGSKHINQAEIEYSSEVFPNCFTKITSLQAFEKAAG